MTMRLGSLPRRRSVESLPPGVSVESLTRPTQWVRASVKSLLSQRSVPPRPRKTEIQNRINRSYALAYPQGAHSQSRTDWETRITEEEFPQKALVVPDVAGDTDDESEKMEEEIRGMRLDPMRRDVTAESAKKRNLARIRTANERDEVIIGKYLPGRADSFFPMRMVGPDDHFLPPDSWVQDLIRILKTKAPTPRSPDFKFATDHDSLKHNGALLEEYHFDFELLLASQEGSTAWHGSEFWPIDQLRSALANHPALDYLEDLYHRELSEGERVRELKEQISRGNHKSATEDDETVAKLLAKEVTHGFSFPFEADLVEKVKGVMVQPCGLACQFALQSDGSRKKKKRLTHDLSYSISAKDVSVNERIDMSLYPEMFYGWCLLRLLHFIVCLRSENPNQKIFLSKYDYSDAYRRVSHAAFAAVQSIIIFAGVAYLALCLAFGGSPNPACFCAFSEALTDLANELLCTKFDPQTLNSPVVDEKTLIPREYPEEGVPFAVGVPPAVEIPLTMDVRKDCFIDDIVVAFLDTPLNRIREGHTVPIAAHVLSRPHARDKSEPVPRKPLFAPDKLEAEGVPCERMIVLGWMFDTRRMIVQLPDDKFAAWSGDVKEILSAGGSTTKVLESTIGRLDHASYLVPLSRHFLNGLRERITPRSKSRKQTVHLSRDDLEDLSLWIKFLKQAKEGISMNLLVLRRPTRIAWSDSCPFGIGGYTLGGFAWRVSIPHESPLYGDDPVNNVLEFLGMAVSMKLLLLEARDEDHPCLLPLGDNTSAIGWILNRGRSREVENISRL